MIYNYLLRQKDSSCHRKLLGMKTEPMAREAADDARKVVFHRVAENLYRLESSGGYYALIKRGDKQFRRSLKTKGVRQKSNPGV
jgi:hypothetical protein